MKRILFTLIFLGMAAMAFGQNAVTTTTLTEQPNGWYRIATSHVRGIEWQFRYTVGNSMSVTLTFARSIGDLPRVYYSERAADNTVDTLQLVLDDVAPVWRGFLMEIPMAADYIYVHVQFAAGNTGILLLEGFLDVVN
jgi:hypothetical protein